MLVSRSCFRVASSDRRTPDSMMHINPRQQITAYDETAAQKTMPPAASPEWADTS